MVGVKQLRYDRLIFMALKRALKRLNAIQFNTMKSFYKQFKIFVGNLYRHLQWRARSAKDHHGNELLL